VTGCSFTARLWRSTARLRRVPSELCTRGLLCAAAFAVASSAGCTPKAHAAAAVPPPLLAARPIDNRIEIGFTAVCSGGRLPAGLDVAVTLEPWSAEPPVFQIASGDDPATSEIIRSPTLTDGEGEISLTAAGVVDPGTEQRQYRLTAARPARGRVTLRYRAEAISTSQKGPRFGLRQDEDAIGGALGSFLVLPLFSEPRPIEINWRVQGCEPEVRAESALGPGFGPLRVVAAPDALRQAGLFLGTPRTVAIDDGDMHLRFSVFGKPAIDVDVAARYAADVLRAERAVFGDRDPTPFYAFMRVLPQMDKYVTGGGNAYGYTSVLGPSAAWNPRMRDHIAHELLHHWVGVGLWLKGQDGASAYWFSEGFAVHYSRVAPLRVGLLPPDEMVSQLNDIALPFYSSPMRSASNAAIEKQIDGGPGDAVLGLIPYWRGALYAAELDAAIRTASRNARSLDDVMHALHERAKHASRNAAGYPEIGDEVFRQLVQAELGDEGVRRFDAVARMGELPRPPGDAFGPCFDKLERRVAEYERGFDFDASLQAPMQVRGLLKGSSAEAAGLAEGDAIVALTPGPRDTRDPTREIAVTIRRPQDKRDKTIRYLPGRPNSVVVVDEWFRRPGLADDRCGHPAPGGGPAR
jgi:predicted metalloprotease with PDZ domain